MEQVMMMAMQTCQHYSQKMAECPLTEYEQQLYEHTARMLRYYAKLQRKIMHIHMLSAKHTLDEEEKKHQEWLEKQMPKIDPKYRGGEEAEA